MPHLNLAYIEGHIILNVAMIDMRMMNIMRNIWTTYRLWQFNDRCFQNPGRVPRGARRRVV